MSGGQAWPKLGQLNAPKRAGETMTEHKHMTAEDLNAPDWYQQWLNDPDATEEARWARQQNDQHPPTLETVVQWWAWSGPPDEEQFARHLANPLLAIYKHRSKDGRFIWKAYQAFRSRGTPVPEEIFLIFDEWARRIESVDESSEVAKAFDMGSRNGASGTEHVKRIRKSCAVVQCIVKHMKILEINHRNRPAKRKPSESDAFRRVAEERNMSFEEVRGHWNRWIRHKDKHGGKDSSSADLESAFGIRPVRG